MSTLTIEEAQARLRDIVAALSPDDVLTIVDEGRPIATVQKLPRTSWPCKAGSARHLPHSMSPDFDQTPVEFAEYVE